MRLAYYNMASRSVIGRDCKNVRSERKVPGSEVSGWSARPRAVEMGPSEPPRVKKSGITLEMNSH